MLAGSGGASTRRIYTKFNKLKGLGYKAYLQLYHSGVTPILDYCSCIWGYQNFGKIDTVQNRSIRFYLNVHTFAPNIARNGDMGWVSSGNRREIEILRYWNRLIRMNENRLTKKVFKWDRNKRRRSGNWSNDVYKVLDSIGLRHMYMITCRRLMLITPNLPTCPPTYLPTYTYLPTHIYLPTYTYLPACLPTYTYLPACLPPTCLPTYTYLPTYLPTYPPTYLPIPTYLPT